MKKSQFLLLAGCVSILQAVVFAQPQWLQYKTSLYMEDEFSTSSRYFPLEKKPADVRMPKFGQYDQKFGKWQHSMDGGKVRWIALDRTRKSGLMDLLYIDSNGDGHLDDEKPYKGVVSDRYRMAFGPVAVHFKGEDGPITYHLNLQYYSYEEQSSYLVISTGCWYEGEVLIDGKPTRVTLIDYNANGTFSDKAESSDCDRIFIGPESRRKSYYVGNYLELGDKLYRVTIAKDGATVEITAAQDAAYGKVKVPETITTFTAAGVNGLFERKPAAGEVSLPEGRYRVHEWTIERKDDKGKNWTLTGSNFPNEKAFTVAKDGTSELDIGEPAISMVSHTIRNNAYYFNQELVGKMGESISLRVGGRQPDAPSLHIYSKSGEYDRTFKLEYG
jgi:hypothetical protein